MLFAAAYIWDLSTFPLIPQTSRHACPHEFVALHRAKQEICITMSPIAENTLSHHRSSNSSSGSVLLRSTAVLSYCCWCWNSIYCTWQETCTAKTHYGTSPCSTATAKLYMFTLLRATVLPAASLQSVHSTLPHKSLLDLNDSDSCWGFGSI